MKDLIDAFGNEVMDPVVYQNLKHVVDEVYHIEDVKKAIEDIKLNKDLNTNFAILACLADTDEVKEFIDSEDFEEVEKMLNQMIDSDQFKDNYSGTMGFIYNLSQNNPDLVNNM